jgi:hypothetical protein
MVRQLAHAAQIHAHNWMVQFNPSASELVTDLPEMLGVYVQSAALLAADWYNSQDEESSYFAFPIDGIEDVRLENLAGWVHRGPQRPENRIRSAAQSIVFDAARNTILLNAQTEGVAIARHEEAAACNDCLVRATLTSKSRNSRSDDIGSDFHPGCEGMWVPVRRGIYDPPSYTAGWRERIDAARQAGNTAPDDIASWLNTN